MALVKKDTPWIAPRSVFAVSGVSLTESFCLFLARQRALQTEYCISALEVDILSTAQLRLLDAFDVHSMLPTTLPVTFTLLVALTAPQVWKIRALAGATIVG